MKDGISGTHLPPNFPFGITMSMIASSKGFFPPLVGAIAWEETLKVLTPAEAVGYISGDGGHGVFQLTDSWPENWQNVSASCDWAIDKFLMPAYTAWTEKTDLKGGKLVQCIAATYNAGWGQAWDGHLAGNVDMWTTGHDYGERVLADYEHLVSGIIPPGVSNPNPS